jgi:hypothetical protein
MFIFLAILRALKTSINRVKKLKETIRNTHALCLFFKVMHFLASEAVIDKLKKQKDPSTM